MNDAIKAKNNQIWISENIPIFKSKRKFDVPKIMYIYVIANKNKNEVIQLKINILCKAFNLLLPPQMPIIKKTGIKIDSEKI